MIGRDYPGGWSRFHFCLEDSMSDSVMGSMGDSLGIRAVQHFVVLRLRSVAHHRSRQQAHTNKRTGSQTNGPNVGPSQRKSSVTVRSLRRLSLHRRGVPADWPHANHAARRAARPPRRHNYLCPPQTGPVRVPLQQRSDPDQPAPDDAQNLRSVSGLQPGPSRAPQTATRQRQSHRSFA